MHHCTCARAYQRCESFSRRYPFTSVSHRKCASGVRRWTTSKVRTIYPEFRKRNCHLVVEGDITWQLRANYGSDLMETWTPVPLVYTRKKRLSILIMNSNSLVSSTQSYVLTVCSVFPFHKHTYGRSVVQIRRFSSTKGCALASKYNVCGGIHTRSNNVDCLLAADISR